MTRQPEVEKAIAILEQQGNMDPITDAFGRTKDHPKMEFIKKFNADLGDNDKLVGILNEAAMHFQRDVPFDADPFVFSLRTVSST